MTDCGQQKGFTQRWCWLISVVTEMGAGGKIPSNARVMPSSKKHPGTYRVISLDLVPGKVTEQDLYKRKSITVLSRQLRMGKN